MCNNCKNIMESYVSIKDDHKIDNMICGKCINNYYSKCKYCGEYENGEHGGGLVGDYDWYCEDCYNEHTGYCENCDSIYTNDEIFYDEYEDKYFCEYCTKECDICDERRLKDKFIKDINYDDVCAECKDTKYKQCSVCDEWIPNDDIKEKDGEYYCEDDLPRKKEKKHPREVTDIQGVPVKQVKEIIREIKKSEDVKSIRVEDDNIFITPKGRNTEDIPVFFPNSELKEPYTGDDYEKINETINGITKVFKDGYGYGAIDENGEIIIPIRYKAMNMTTKYIAVRYEYKNRQGQYFGHSYDGSFDFTGKLECPLIISSSGYFSFMTVYDMAKTR